MCRSLKWSYCIFASDRRVHPKEKHHFFLHTLYSNTRSTVPRNSPFSTQRNRFATWILVFSLHIAIIVLMAITFFLSIFISICHLIDCHTSYTSLYIFSISQALNPCLLKNNTTIEQINHVPLNSVGELPMEASSPSIWVWKSLSHH